MRYFQLNNVEFYDMLNYLTIYLTTFIGSNQNFEVSFDLNYTVCIYFFKVDKRLEF